MVTTGSSPEDPVAWARRVNRRWIVHHGLESSAEAYLNHLEAVDRERQRQACERAYRMVCQCGPLEDPKPWFYAGLFSRATAAEAAEFLQHHPFTAACISGTAAAWGAQFSDLSQETQDKLRRIRAALSR